jgi:2-polyprenyl-3-methyl-5-hydroxy-6-metoxy-1,4-benzoquinol methylase
VTVLYYIFCFIKKFLKIILPYGFTIIFRKYIKYSPAFEGFCRLAWKTGFQKNHFQHKNDANVFSTIYNGNLWGSNESRSGGGSEVGTTEIIRKTLPVLWKQYGIKTFLDVPCGDYNWMKEVAKDNISYIGGDIVKELIERNNRSYKSENVSFKVIDITKDNLPAVDMIFCKDCLQHLSYENIFKALENFKKSNSKYLLTSTYPLTPSNWDIFDGDYRPLNLRKKPFRLPVPIEKIHETPGGGVEKDKYMYLYKLENIKYP